MSTHDDQAIETVLARARLPMVNQDEHARLAQIYAELQAQVESLRLEEVRHREPAVIYRLETEQTVSG